MTHTTIQAHDHGDRCTRWLLIGIGIYSGMLVTLLNVHILSSGSTQERAIILMAEASMNPANLIGGFWVFVYGLMVYLPACTVPVDRGAKPIRWWNYPLAVILPLIAAVPVVPAIILLRQWLGIELLSGA